MMESAGPVAETLGCVRDMRAALTELSARVIACAAATLT
jgi:hypothetical protein